MNEIITAAEIALGRGVSLASIIEAIGQLEVRPDLADTDEHPAASATVPAGAK